MKKLSHFDITHFGKKSNKSTYSLYSYGTTNPLYNNLEDKNDIELSQCNSLLEQKKNTALTVAVIFHRAKKCLLFIISCGLKRNKLNIPRGKRKYTLNAHVLLIFHCSDLKFCMGPRLLNFFHAQLS